MGDYSTETLSHLDREFILDLLRKGERLDGRAFNEYRELEIEVNIVPAKAEGSALVRLGDTSVVAGVKVLVGEPYPDAADEGVTMVTAEMSPIASPLFELGPPKEDAIELARIVDRGIRKSGTVDTLKSGARISLGGAAAADPFRLAAATVAMKTKLAAKAMANASMIARRRLPRLSSTPLAFVENDLLRSFWLIFFLPKWTRQLFC